MRSTVQHRQCHVMWYMTNTAHDDKQHNIGREKLRILLDGFLAILKRIVLKNNGVTNSDTLI